MPKLNIDEIIANLKTETGVRKNDGNDKKEFSMVSIICGAGEGLQKRSHIKHLLDSGLNDVSVLLKRKLGEDFEVSVSILESANKLSFSNEESMVKFLDLISK